MLSVIEIWQSDCLVKGHVVQPSTCAEIAHNIPTKWSPWPTFLSFPSSRLVLPSWSPLGGHAAHGQIPIDRVSNPLFFKPAIPSSCSSFSWSLWSCSSILLTVSGSSSTLLVSVAPGIHSSTIFSRTEWSGVATYFTVNGNFSRSYWLHTSAWNLNMLTHFNFTTTLRRK